MITLGPRDRLCHCKSDCHGGNGSPSTSLHLSAWVSQYLPNAWAVQAVAVQELLLSYQHLFGLRVLLV